MPEFVYRFFEELVAAFDVADDCWIKPLGDGAMLVLGGASSPNTTLKEVLDAIVKFETVRVPRIRKEFQEQYGLDFQFGLGWGISRGDVTPLGRSHLHSRSSLGYHLGKVFGQAISDYFGEVLNHTSRLCDKARPGIVIDRNKFSSLPNSKLEFSEESVRLKGVKGPTRIWRCKNVVLAPVRRLLKKKSESPLSAQKIAPVKLFQDR